jgi:hypothetical protein
MRGGLTHGTSYTACALKQRRERRSSAQMMDMGSAKPTPHCSAKPPAQQPASNGNTGRNLPHACAQSDARHVQALGKCNTVDH